MRWSKEGAGTHGRADNILDMFVYICHLMTGFLDENMIIVICEYSKIVAESVAAWHCAA